LRGRKESYNDSGDWVVALDGHPFRPDWIANIPREGEETRAVVNAGGGPDDLLVISPVGMRTMKPTGDAGLSPPLQARGLPSFRPSLAVNGGGRIQSAPNRAARRKLAALKSVK
jgi:hypothetical protein